MTYLARKVAEPEGPNYVLKELKRQNDQERRARMSQEVANLKALEHLQIAKLIESNADRFKDDEELYLVTEFIPGPHLTEFVSAAQPDVPTAAKIVEGILSTLRYCHDRSVIHRDIKPENIILRSSNPIDPVLLDFGLSFNEENQPSDFQTSDGQHLGNRFIVLPEYGVRGGDKHTPLSDISQCTGILFYLITSFPPDNIIDEHDRPPHMRPAPMAQLKKLPPQTLTKLNRIFDMGFATQLMRRWQSIGSLLAAIKDLYSTQISPAVSFEEKLATARQQLLQTPDHTVSERIEELNRIAEQRFQTVNNVFSHELQGVLIHQGAVGLSPIQNCIWAKGSAFKYKFGAQPSQILFYLFRENSEAVLRAAIGRQGHRTPDPRVETREILRIAIFDTEAASMLEAAMKSYFSDVYLPDLSPK